MAGSWHGRGRIAVEERHGICESAYRVKYISRNESVSTLYRVQPAYYRDYFTLHMQLLLQNITVSLLSNALFFHYMSTPFAVEYSNIYVHFIINEYTLCSRIFCILTVCLLSLFLVGNRCRLQLKRDGTSAETRFRLSEKRSSPFESAGVSAQSAASRRSIHIV
jgi:hypothetical protein